MEYTELDGLSISRIGLGCWAFGGHGWGEVKDTDSVSAIRCALESGINFYDTADTYGFGKSEEILAETLGSDRHNVLIATKGGVRWDQSGNVWTDISAGYIRLAVENSLRRLRLDTIPLYYIHKPDGKTDIRDSIAELEHLREEGKIRSIGVANFGPTELLQALQVAHIKAIQVRFNLFEQEVLEKVRDICMKNKVLLVAWGALADGLLTGKFTANTKFDDDDHRSRMPDFIGDRFINNLKCVELIRKLAAARGVSAAQFALRWVMDSAKFTVALFGAKTNLQVKENLGVLGWSLTLYEITETKNIVKQYRGLI